MQNALSPSWSVVIQPDDSSVTVSTLLIPKSHISLLDNMLYRRGCRLSSYIKYLLVEYRSAVLDRNLPVARKCKCLYQNAGLDLHRRNFRPDNESWLELGMLARSLGISRCCLFIRLLLLDVKKNEKNAVPTNFSGTGISIPFAIRYGDVLIIEGNFYQRTLGAEKTDPPFSPSHRTQSANTKSFE